METEAQKPWWGWVAPFFFMVASAAALLFVYVDEHWRTDGHTLGETASLQLDTKDVEGVRSETPPATPVAAAAAAVRSFNAVLDDFEAKFLRSSQVEERREEGSGGGGGDNQQQQQKEPQPDEPHPPTHAHHHQWPPHHQQQHHHNSESHGAMVAEANGDDHVREVEMVEYGAKGDSVHDNTHTCAAHTQPSHDTHQSTPTHSTANAQSGAAKAVDVCDIHGGVCGEMCVREGGSKGQVMCRGGVGVSEAGSTRVCTGYGGGRGGDDAMTQNKSSPDNPAPASARIHQPAIKAPSSTPPTSLLSVKEERTETATPRTHAHTHAHTHAGVGQEKDTPQAHARADIQHTHPPLRPSRGDVRVEDLLQAHTRTRTQAAVDVCEGGGGWMVVVHVYEDADGDSSDSDVYDEEEWGGGGGGGDEGNSQQHGRHQYGGGNGGGGEGPVDVEGAEEDRASETLSTVASHDSHEEGVDDQDVRGWLQAVLKQQPVQGPHRVMRVQPYSQRLWCILLHTDADANSFVKRLSRDREVDAWVSTLPPAVGRDLAGDASTTTLQCRGLLRDGSMRVRCLRRGGATTNLTLASRGFGGW